MRKLRSYVLPTALVLGGLLHAYCSDLAFVTPWCIFLILLLNFVAVDFHGLRPHRVFWPLLALQAVLPLVLYLALKMAGADEALAQGVLIGVLCPVAASVVVIACMLGARREMVTAFTLVAYLMTTFLAPVYFSFIGVNQQLPFMESFLLILGHTFPVLALPFFLAYVLRRFLPRVSSCLEGWKDLSFPIWAFVLMISLGQTVHSIILRMDQDALVIISLGIAAALLCIAQFLVGRLIGKPFGERVASGQLLGQKNSAMGIWMAGIYLDPLSAVYFAFYAIFQNLFNSYQLWALDRKVKKS